MIGREGAGHVMGTLLNVMRMVIHLKEKVLRLKLSRFLKNTNQKKYIKLHKIIKK